MDTAGLEPASPYEWKAVCKGPKKLQETPKNKETDEGEGKRSIPNVNYLHLRHRGRSTIKLHAQGKIPNKTLQQTKSSEGKIRNSTQ